MAKKSVQDANEQHVVGIRQRVTGVGSYKMTLSDLDDVRSYTIAPLTLLLLNRVEPLKIANFQSQRIRLKGEVTEIDEYFTISKIIFYTKQVAMEYPG